MKILIFTGIPLPPPELLKEYLTEDIPEEKEVEPEVEKVVQSEVEEVREEEQNTQEEMERNVAEQLMKNIENMVGTYLLKLFLSTFLSQLEESPIK